MKYDISSFQPRHIVSTDLRTKILKQSEPQIEIWIRDNYEDLRNGTMKICDAKKNASEFLSMEPSQVSKLILQYCSNSDVKKIEERHLDFIN